MRQFCPRLGSRAPVSTGFKSQHPGTGAPTRGKTVRSGALRGGFDRARASRSTPRPALLAAAESLRQEVEAIDELETGELNIGTGPYPALALMDKVCARFVDQYPGIRLNIRTDNWQDLRLALLDHEIELFVADTGELSGDPDLEITHLPQPEVVVFCRHDHPLAQATGVVWGDLLDYPIAMTRVPEDMERNIQAMSAQQGG